MYSNTTDVITGTTFNGRTAPIPGIEQVVGPTVVTVPFRTIFRRDRIVTELLKNVQQQYVDTVLFEQIGLQTIEHLSADADTACGFKSLLVIHSIGGNAPNLMVMNQDILLSTDYALTIECDLREHSIVMRAAFDEQVLNKQEVQRTLRQFEKHSAQAFSRRPCYVGSWSSRSGPGGCGRDHGVELRPSRKSGCLCA